MTQMNPATPSPNQFWAKYENEPPRWHPLIAHSADAAAVFERLLVPGSTLRQRLLELSDVEMDGDRLIRLLTYLVALHDLGKANHGFQAKGPLGDAERFPHEGHVKIVLESLRRDEFSGPITALFDDLVDPTTPLLPLFSAAIAHHGRPYDPENVGFRGAADLMSLWRGDPLTGRQPIEEVRRIGTHAKRWIGLGGDGPLATLPSDPRFTHLFAGLVTLADWIGSTETAFPFTPAADLDPNAYWEEARQRADRACIQIGVASNQLIRNAEGRDLYRLLFPRIFSASSGHEPTDLQAAAAQMSIPPHGGLLLIEAATGSGKTEAAMAFYARLRGEGRVAGLMFALPTRATARAMYDRVRAAIEQLYPDDPPGITLAVGGEDPVSSAGDPLTARRSVTHDDDDAHPSALFRWASSHNKKFMAAEIVVGTIDQALLATLAVKHAHLRLAGLARHFLVVDEVHSHDRYMLRLLRSLLDFHTDCGGYALAMSATLSADARARMVGEEDASTIEVAKHRPYPSLATFDPKTGWAEMDLEQDGQNRSIGWSLVDSDGWVERAVDAARAGARVCVIRNLVKDAQDTIHALVDRGAEEQLWRPTNAAHRPPYHSKYAPPDRRFLDRAVLESFGPGVDPGSGCILVATQVVEQSLDVDFDLLITDLAPIEVLLQRMGRLHRHRPRNPHRPPGYESPLVLVHGPADPFDPGRKPGPGAHGWGVVYQEWPALELTRRCVASFDTIRIPQQNRALLEDVYHWTRLEALGGEPGWEAAVAQMEGRALSHDGQARDSVLHFHEPYHRNSDRFADERSVRTRLGDDTIRVILDPPAPCWYARDEVATYVDRPVGELERTGLDLSEPTIGPGRAGADGVMEYPLGNRTLRYEPTGWRLRGET